MRLRRVETMNLISGWIYQKEIAVVIVLVVYN